MCLFDSQGVKVVDNDDHGKSATPTSHSNYMSASESYINAGSLSTGDNYIALGIQSETIHYFTDGFDASTDLPFNTNDNSTVNVVGQQLHFITNTNNTAETPIPTIDEFFGWYDTLFLDIPNTGTNSHETLIERSSDQIGLSLTDVLDRMKELQRENEQLKAQVNQISNTQAIKSANL